MLGGVLGGVLGECFCRNCLSHFFSTINPTASEVAMAHAKNPKIHLKNE